MQSLETIVKTLSGSKVELSDRFHVKRLAVFGTYARNEQRPDSDLDLLVEFDMPVGIEFIDLADHLENTLKVNVDLVSRNGIKPKYLREIQADLKYV